MTSLFHSRAYEQFATLLARFIFGFQFLLGAFYKIPGTQGFGFEVGATTAAGLPHAAVFVALAFVLEVVCALALITGYYARQAALVLAVFTLSLALIFYTNFSDQMIMGEFISHLAFIAGLLYISVYGARSFAVQKDS